MYGWINESTDKLCEALLSLKTKEECLALLEDLCTIKEIQDLSQRLAVAQMLNKGIGYAVISKETGASTATISRVRKCYEYGEGGYKTVIERINGSEEKNTKAEGIKDIDLK